MDGQDTKWRRNIAENLNRLSMVHERYRQTTDGRTMTYNEREREFTLAKNERKKGTEVMGESTLPPPTEINFLLYISLCVYTMFTKQ